MSFPEGDSGAEKRGAAGEDRPGGERRRRVPRPLDRASLQDLALAYVARFATSRAKLVSYLGRKLRERGWAEEGAGPDPEAVADRMMELRYIDDEAFASAKAASLMRRGYGKARVRAALQASGIGEEDRAGAMEAAEEGGLAAALRFAERKKLGPYAGEPLDQAGRQKALAAMLRAGHDYATARRIVSAAPGDFESLLSDKDPFR